MADVPALRALAREIGLDPAAFDRCLDNRVPGVLPVDELIRTLAGLAFQ